MNLKTAQLAAIEHISSYASSREAVARSTINQILTMSDVTKKDFDDAVSAISNHAQIGLHFHPDRLNHKMDTVAKALVSDGIYKSQFETFLSNGKLSPKKGGPRDIWENNLFGDAYNGTDVSAVDRPKYGALDLMRLPDGPCPRFGSCCFLLDPSVLSRSTFTYMDSYRNPPEKGTISTMHDIFAALLTESFERDFALGIADMRPPRLINHLKCRLQEPFENPADSPPSRNLDHYIEAQVHGEIRLLDDVDALIADPSFRGSDIGIDLERLCKFHDIAMYWHGGFVLNVEDVPSDFRGPEMPALARRVAENGLLDVRMIGCAAADLKRTPTNWEKVGSPEHVLQALKLLWHVLVKFGKSNDNKGYNNAMHSDVDSAALHPRR